MAFWNMQPETTETEKSIKKGIDLALDYIIANKSQALSNYLQADCKKELTAAAKYQLQMHGYSGKLLDDVMEMFAKYMWGYYILDDLINDEEVSDIKCIGSDHIQDKRLGDRETADVKFESQEDYERFVSMVAVKNKKSLADVNALLTFTDKDSNPNARLRFCIATKYVSDIDEAYLSIRKIPKHKYSMDDLVAKGMMTPAQKKFLDDIAVNASGVLFTGKGASGKTSLMNAMVEKIPHNRSVAVMQENEEIFTYPVSQGGHPDMMCMHIVENSGEGKISYTLADLARKGLVFDLDYYIIGEIKGNEAADFMMASYTGHQCWCSVHGKNSQEGIYKLADYVHQATGYALSECFRMLGGISYVVYLDHFKVKEICKIDGYDFVNQKLITHIVDFPIENIKKGGECA